MKVEVAVLGSPSLIVLLVSVDVKQHGANGPSGLCGHIATLNKHQELCESRDGRPGLPVPNSPLGLCGREATLNLNVSRAQELCESGGGRPGLPVPNSP